MRGEEHAGYLDIKLPPKNRNKRSKVWCNRWVVLHKVSDLSVAKMLAKLDIYTHAEQASIPENKINSVLLEHVTSIKLISRSKTHPNAFEIREGDTPVLFFSAATATETQLWVCFLREIFNLNTSDIPGLYNVWIRENDYSNRLGLSGDYLMDITSTSISISKADGQGNFQWPLSSLKKFYLRPVVPEAKHNHILIIEPGESIMASGNFIMFVTPRAEEILIAIRANISVAMKERSRNRTTSSSSSAPQYNRYNSLPQSLKSDTLSLCDFQRSCSIEQERPMSMIDQHSDGLREALNLDLSMRVPPPKPARTWVHVPSTPTSDTPSSLDENKETCEMFLAEEALIHVPPTCDSEIRFPDCDSVRSVEPANPITKPCQGEKNNGQKFPSSMPNNCGSKDSEALSITSETGSFDFKQQPNRSNSGDSGISLSIDRQKVMPYPKKAILQKPAITEALSKSLESDKESDDYSGSHIYWDIDPEEIDVLQTDVPSDRNNTPGSRSHSLQNLLPNANDYEDLVDIKKNQKEIKNVPPALPKRPKSLAFSKDKAFLKMSMKDRFLESFSNLNPQIKQKLKNQKGNSEANDLNTIIKDFQKWAAQGKKTDLKETEPSGMRRARRESDGTLNPKKDLVNTWQRKRHLHSWSTSDTSSLFWNDEETKEGVFVVERRADPLAFLKTDPFRLLKHKTFMRQSSFDVRLSTIDAENKDTSPVLSPLVVHSSKHRDFGSGHWSDGDTKSSDGEFDLELFSLNRRRSISLEGKLEYQVMLKQLKKDLRDTATEQSLANDVFLHKSNERSGLTMPSALCTPPTTPISPNSTKLNGGILSGYIDMTGRLRSSSASETTAKQSKINQKRKASLL